LDPLTSTGTGHWWRVAQHRDARAIALYLFLVKKQINFLNDDVIRKFS
jgi:hypothetical protein